jgi:hypothetical protein
MDMANRDYWRYSGCSKAERIAASIAVAGVSKARRFHA